MFFEYISFMCEFFFGIGVLTMLFGLPTFLILKLIVMPAIQIRKAMKAGKPFKEAFKAEFPNDGTYHHQFPTHSFGSSSIPQLQDMNTSSSYVGLPNNIFTSK